MKILYLCHKHTYDTKMSRIRFQGIAALAKIADVVYSGIGWDNWDTNFTVDENIEDIYNGDKPDWIIMYKPLGLEGIEDTKVKKCLRYNEMWDIKGTKKEIYDSGADLVICHHLNDIPKYKDVPLVSFVNVPHSAEASVYRDYGLEKDYDVLLTGAVSSHYPFRARLKKIINQHLKKKAKCKILGHPGGDLRKLHGETLDGYAKELNKAKIVLTCSSKYKYRLGKYIEIPMCGSVLAGDLPDDDQDDLESFMLVLNTTDTDEEIVDKIMSVLHDTQTRENMIQRGLFWSERYTQERYAKRLLKELENHS